MFDRIADRYDLLNRVLSLGIDQRWRRRAVRALALDGRPDPPRVLDLATGTGDLAILAARARPDVRVEGVDPSRRMLEEARTKVQAAGLTDRVRLVVGDAESLPYPDAAFDGVTIAFGIRNVPDRELGLREMCRVTRPGGRVVVLELSDPGGGVLGRVARFHVHTLVPRIGALLSGEREYRYLETSIAAFPPAAEFSTMMRDAGLRVLVAQALTLGVCHLFVGEAPERP
jgi:demethylmenaquinone methyltransferase / 2-methoxy-6-polyprenyl-1,4-benzoquinol methylase